MKAPCDCDKSPPAGAPPDSVKNAAALWISAGKLIGYAEAIDMAASYMQREAEKIADTWVKSTRLKVSTGDRAKLVGMLQQVGALFAAGQDGRRTEGEVLKKTAVAMADRLERQKPRGFLRRCRDALVSFRG